ncbi:MAG: HI0074 family nucleotidyltransferase substrate-binding subunit [Bacilli bacterium]
MERVKLALERAQQALLTLQEASGLADVTTLEQDGGIQRFEYTFEAVWKAGRHFLRTYAGLDVGSPKEVIRTCREVGILSVEETEYALEMANDRNLTSHTYDRAVAEGIFHRLAGHASLMGLWLERMSEKLEEHAPQST